jgi:hypothetical protein
MDFPWLHNDLHRIAGRHLLKEVPQRRVVLLLQQQDVDG